jgi:transglutaminase-like putative cysteine protease
MLSSMKRQKKIIWRIEHGGDRIKRKTICSVFLLLAFALILNVNTTSATTINDTNSVSSSVNSDSSSSMTNTNTVSAYTSEASTINTQVSSTSDSTKPRVTSSDPVNNSVTVHTNKVIKITFNEPIKIGTGWIDLKDSNRNIIPTKINISGNILSIDPVNYLTRGMKYTLQIHSGSFTDLSGNKVDLYQTKFTTYPPTKTTASAEYQAYQNYLIATENCQSTSTTIKALAASITKGSTTDYGKAVRIFNWVRDNISYSFYYNTKYGALGTLNKRSANCVDTAHLLIALERAAGIPARYKHGTCRFTSGTWYGHVWAQVYVNGKWYNADATSSRNSFGVINNWNTSTFTLKGTYASLPF